MHLSLILEVYTGTHARHLCLDLILEVYTVIIAKQSWTNKSINLGLILEVFTVIHGRKSWTCKSINLGLIFDQSGPCIETQTIMDM